jgi:hypothetical protein
MRSDTVSVQGVAMDKRAFTQAFNGGKGKGMERERNRIHKVIDDLIIEAKTLQYQDNELYQAAFEYVKYKIEEKYVNRAKNKENVSE